MKSSVSKFKALLKEKGISFEEKSGKIIINGGGDVYLRSLTALPEGVQFNNGGDVDLKNKKIEIKSSYNKRFRIKVKRNTIILYKRVSKDYKTQEGTKNETLWKPGTIVTHPAWKPTEKECGEGKFHACARPFWCDAWRSKKSDRYIAIKVNIKDLYEWKDNPYYPQKIGFRKCEVLKNKVKRIEK